MSNSLDLPELGADSWRKFLEQVTHVVTVQDELATVPSNPVATGYWRPCSPLFPCPLCKNEEQCSASADERWTSCIKQESGVWTPASGQAWLHDRSPPAVPLVGKPDLVSIYDEEIALRDEWKETQSVKLCGKSGPVVANRQTGRISHKLSKCYSFRCTRCGTRRADGLLAYVASLWSRESTIWFSTYIDDEDVDKAGERVRSRARLKDAQYLKIRVKSEKVYVFSSEKLDGRRSPKVSESLNAIEAYNRLRRAITRPADIRLSSSCWGTWSLPSVHRGVPKRKIVKTQRKGRGGAEAQESADGVPSSEEEPGCEEGFEKLKFVGTKECQQALKAVWAEIAPEQDTTVANIYESPVGVAPSVFISAFRSALRCYADQTFRPDSDDD